MFGGIDFSKSILFLYPDLGSAISFFFKINQGEDVSFEPNINNSLSLLSCQNNLYQVSLESLNLSSVLNIAIIRDNECNCSLKSSLLNVSKEELDHLLLHYKVEKIIYDIKSCSLCNSEFKIWDHNENYGFEGCVYDPCYYHVITQNNFTESDVGWGDKNKIDDEVKKLKFDKSDVFFIAMRGGPWGLYLSKNPIPKNLKHNSFICWICIKEMMNDLIFIWSH